MATTKKDFQAAGGLPKYSTFYCGTLQAALKASAIQSVAGVGQEAAASMAKEEHQPADIEVLILPWRGGQRHAGGLRPFPRLAFGAQGGVPLPCYPGRC